MKFTVCPFCAVASESPHDSQEACILALQSEIERTRRILTQFSESAMSLDVPHVVEEDARRP